jgi:hypothetical protein
MQRLELAALMLVAAVVAACGDSSVFESASGSDLTGEVRIRALNAAPGAPALDVLINDETIAEAIGYGRSSSYQTVSGGNNELRVNSNFGGLNEELATRATPLTPGATYTVLVAGGDEGVVPVVLTDDNGVPPAGQAKLRLVHAAPSADQLNVYVTAPGADLVGTAPTFTVGFSTASSYATLPAGSYQLRVTPASSQEVLIDTGALELADGDIRTVVALETAAGGPPYSTAILDDRAE